MGGDPAGTGIPLVFCVACGVTCGLGSAIACVLSPANVGRRVARVSAITCTLFYANAGRRVARVSAITCTLSPANAGRRVARVSAITCTLSPANAGRRVARVSAITCTLSPANPGRRSVYCPWSGSHTRRSALGCYLRRLQRRRRQGRCDRTIKGPQRHGFPP